MKWLSTGLVLSLEGAVVFLVAVLFVVEYRYDKKKLDELERRLERVKVNLVVATKQLELLRRCGRQSRISVTVSVNTISTYSSTRSRHLSQIFKNRLRSLTRKELMEGSRVRGPSKVLFQMPDEEPGTSASITQACVHASQVSQPAIEDGDCSSLCNVIDGVHHHRPRNNG